MDKDYSNYCGSKAYDAALVTVPHFSDDKYPEMMPWIGADYLEQEAKVLIIGESHYFNNDFTVHHDPNTWYSRTFHESLDSRVGHRVRYQITRAIGGHFRRKSAHPMHQNIEKVLGKTNCFETGSGKHFDAIAYLNYFQRPANRKGGSIAAQPQDLSIARETIEKVVEIIEPDLILFASVKAYKAAKESGFLSTLNIPVDYSAHPCSAHWNKACKKYGKFKGENVGAISGSKRFAIALERMLVASKTV